MIGLDLPAGDVRFTARAQAHARERHPGDFEICLTHLPRIVRAPDYVGRAPQQADGFELIGEARQERSIILVAIKLERDREGRYIVASTYRLTRRALESRLLRGFVVRT
jgi:hypothetical protein